MTKYQIDETHSSIHFSIRHLVIAKVRGRFTKFSGAIELDESDVTRSTVTADIEAASIHTNEDKRDAHLRSADFLDVASSPIIRFASQAIEHHGNRLRLTGALTIRDVTREVILDVEELGAAKDSWGNERIAFAATARIDRTEFGLQWNQVLETGGFLVGDKIDVDFDIQAVKARAMAA